MAEQRTAITVQELQGLILTLQYCLETFEQACQCGRCDPCTEGRQDIQRSILILEDFISPGVGRTYVEDESVSERAKWAGSRMAGFGVFHFSPPSKIMPAGTTKSVAPFGRRTEKYRVGKGLGESRHLQH
jgi:hypothetical protein